MAEHVVSRKTYFLIWATLMVLTVVTAAVARVDLDSMVFSAVHYRLAVNATVAMMIASTKATLVVLFFMHLRWSNTVTRVAAAAGVLWLVIMLVLTSADFFTRSWLTS